MRVMQFRCSFRRPHQAEINAREQENPGHRSNYQCELHANRCDISILFFHNRFLQCTTATIVRVPDRPTYIKINSGLAWELFCERRSFRDELRSQPNTQIFDYCRVSLIVGLHANAKTHTRLVSHSRTSTHIQRERLNTPVQKLRTEKTGCTVTFVPKLGFALSTHTHTHTHTNAHTGGIFIAMADPFESSHDDGCDAFRGARAPPPAPLPPPAPPPPLPLLSHPPQQSQRSTPNSSLYHAGMLETSPTSSASSGSSQKPSRRLWSPMEDLFLLTLVLTHKHALPVSSNVRRFWEFVSFQLLQEHSLQRNTRQCRDRFNLLYTRGVRNAACNVEPGSHRDALILKIAQVFDSTGRGHYRLSRAYSKQPRQDTSQLLYQGLPFAQAHVPDHNAYSGFGLGPATIDTADSVSPETTKFPEPSELTHISDSVSSLMASTQSLATDFQDLSERFTQLSDQVKFIQMRLDNIHEPPYHNRLMPGMYNSNPFQPSGFPPPNEGHG
ncbi:LANO_0E11034g1_1 [Lachancea nothofagi CBS 11611]|uniref:LANO_0E11034g1_1 n=1 Tax=Lachancea nothofagi CBS 11611 TaxID=1266666 RepID=A0A1G4JX38_9SACH|nr:LANO_0E11034g1_1 [Lachancea nothofagi CBS 11611]